MPVRITVLLKKLESLSEEEFHEHWVKKHVPLYLSVPTAQRVLISYNQYHVSESLTASLLTAVGVPTEFITTQFSGAAEFIVNSTEDFAAIAADPVYLRDVAPDDDTFIKRPECMMLVGEEKVFWQEGKAV